MKHYKVKKLSIEQKEYLKYISVINVGRRTCGFPEIELEAKDWFEEYELASFDGEIETIKVTGKAISFDEIDKEYHMDIRLALPKPA